MKRIVLKNKVETIIAHRDVRCQYNPKRFEQYREAVCGRNVHLDEVLMPDICPHFVFARGYVRWGKNNPLDTHYRLMQRLYGRSEEWIEKKVNKFIDLIEDTRAGQIRERPIVLRRPIYPSDANTSYPEIYEGHHRIAAFFALFPTQFCKVELYDF
jgi:hypothetical protein